MKSSRGKRKPCCNCNFGFYFRNGRFINCRLWGAALRIFLSYHSPDENLARAPKGALEALCNDVEVFFAPAGIVPATGHA